ncbi:MAG: UPF0182 family protein, partial [Gemmatimonadaceae bacterium]|nr:UPF0182 family protein [Gemmatimonadaceae bacterium]
MTRRRLLWATGALAALVLLAGRWMTGLYTDYLWFASLGAREVWRARALAGASVVAGTFLVAFLFTFANLYAVRRSVVSLVLPRRLANIEIGEEVPGRYLTMAVALLSATVAAVLAMGSDHWSQALLATGGKSFRESDPYFGADLGFFVYWLPFEMAMHAWTAILVISVSGLVVLLYA